LSEDIPFALEVQDSEINEEYEQSCVKPCVSTNNTTSDVESDSRRGCDNLEPPEPPYASLDAISDFSALSLVDEFTAPTEGPEPNIISEAYGDESPLSTSPTTVVFFGGRENTASSESKGESSRSKHFLTASPIEATNPAINVGKTNVEASKNSRVSNKKRRKQLKLAKKAAAAAAISANLSSQIDSQSSSPPPTINASRRAKVQRSSLTSRKLKSSKKTNIAVASTIQSLMSYREGIC